MEKEAFTLQATPQSVLSGLYVVKLLVVKCVCVLLAGSKIIKVSFELTNMHMFKYQILRISYVVFFNYERKKNIYEAMLLCRVTLRRSVIFKLPIHTRTRLNKHFRRISCDVYFNYEQSERFEHQIII